MLGSVKFDTTPDVVMRPMELLAAFVNQRAPSGPRVIDSGRSTPAPVNMETTPDVVNCPIEFAFVLVNHSAPSGPETIPRGWSIPENFVTGSV